MEDWEGRRAANRELSAWLLRGKGRQQGCGSAICYQRCHSPFYCSWYVCCVSSFVLLYFLALFPLRNSNNVFLYVSRTSTKVLMRCYKRLLEQNGLNSNSIWQLNDDWSHLGHASYSCLDTDIKRHAWYVKWWYLSVQMAVTSIPRDFFYRSTTSFSKEKNKLD